VVSRKDAKFKHRRRKELTTFSTLFAPLREIKAVIRRYNYFRFSSFDFRFSLNSPFQFSIHSSTALPAVFSSISLCSKSKPSKNLTMQTFTKTRKALSILVLSSSILFLASCQKDHDNNDHRPVPAITAISEFKNGDEFIRFEYNTDGTVKKATVSNALSTNGNIVDYNITYSEAKKIAAAETSAGERIVPVYESDMMTRADVFEGNERTGYINYRYENNVLTRATLYWGQGTDYEPFFELAFTQNDKGNITETIAMAANGQPGQLIRMGHIAYTHDTGTNPLYEHKDLLALLFQSVSKNNIIQEDHFDSNLVLEDGYVYTYSYRLNGLPDHATIKQGLPGQQPVSSQLEFKYR
jgi:hypothetical protein